MKILDNLIYEAGGYSAKALENASYTERRQILQLGSAVLFSIIASMISWGVASTLLVESGQDKLTALLVPLVCTVVVIPLFMSLNRNLIFYSDMKSDKPDVYTYSASKKRPTNTLIYLRVALVVTVAVFNAKAPDQTLGLFLIGVLAMIELYPLLLKWQMGQTILGRRIQAKLNFQHQRGVLKEEEYSHKLKQTKQRLACRDCPASMNDSEGAEGLFEHVRLIK